MWKDTYPGIKKVQMADKCLWCGRIFFAGPGVYKFCDECTKRIMKTEEVVEKLTKQQVNLRRELEERFWESDNY